MGPFNMADNKKIPLSALARGAKLAARREHTAADLARKLRRKGHGGDEVEAALEKLREKGYVNDERAAAAYIGERQRKGFGPKRITMELGRLGIPGAAASAALAELYPAALEYEILGRLVERAPASQRSDPQKLAGKLLRRGFRAGAIRDALAGVDDEMGELLEFPAGE